MASNDNEAPRRRSSSSGGTSRSSSSSSSRSSSSRSSNSSSSSRPKSSSSNSASRSSASSSKSSSSSSRPKSSSSSSRPSTVKSSGSKSSGATKSSKKSSSPSFKEQLEQVKEKLGSKAKLVAGVLACVVVFAILLSVVPSMLGGGGDSSPAPTKKAQQNVSAVIPDLKMVPRLEAEKKLKDLGFYNIDTDSIKEYADSSDEEVIIEQAPAANSKAMTGDHVLLKYGSKRLYDKGQTEVAIASVTKLTVANARKKLTDQGFEKITYDKESNNNFTEDQLTVTEQIPAADEKIRLNTEVVLKVAPGFQFEDIKKQLAANFLPYKTFAKFENVKGRDVKVTFKQKDISLLTQTSLNERAKSLKVGIEEVLGQKIGSLTLINPGVREIGFSDKAVRKVTDDGLTVPKARSACEAEVAKNLNRVKIDWENGTLQEEITDLKITLSATATSEPADGQTEEVVINCVVSGTGDDPKIENVNIK